MVEELRHAIEQVEGQPEAVQRHIAELIWLALEEQEWDELTATPDSQDLLARLSREIDERRRQARSKTVAGNSSVHITTNKALPRFTGSFACGRSTAGARRLLAL
jgi:hypothetical protein